MRIRSRLDSALLKASALFVFLFLAACSTTGQSTYQETHTLTDLTIVFLDDASLRERYEALAQQSAVTFSSLATSGSINTVRGFYDYRSRTIYCPKMDFYVCGHELHHAALGRFHPDR